MKAHQAHQVRTAPVVERTNAGGRPAAAAIAAGRCGATRSGR